MTARHDGGRAEVCWSKADSESMGVRVQVPEEGAPVAPEFMVVDVEDRLSGVVALESAECYGGVFAETRCSRVFLLIV